VCRCGLTSMTYGDPMTYGDTGRGTKSMFGEQVRSTSRSAPSFGFGTSSRHGPSRTSASPGPSAYTMPQAVGTQPDSRKNSSSQYGFGSNGRFKDKAKMGPGPAAYDMPPGVGRQVDSGKTNQPRFGFGTENSSNQQPAHGVASPGPIYSLNAAVGSQQLSQRETQPSWNFTTEHRFKSDQQRHTISPGPGPGAYRHHNSVGPQIASTKASSQRTVFGTSSREHMSKVFISTEHGKAYAGKSSPGPASYSLHNATGRQPASKYRTAPGWGFGTAGRFTREKIVQRQTATPGPGSYRI